MLWYVLGVFTGLLLAAGRHVVGVKRHYHRINALNRFAR